MRTYASSGRQAANTIRPSGLNVLSGWTARYARRAPTLRQTSQKIPRRYNGFNPVFGGNSRRAVLMATIPLPAALSTAPAYQIEEHLYDTVRLPQVVNRLMTNRALWIMLHRPCKSNKFVAV